MARIERMGLTLPYLTLPSGLPNKADPQSKNGPQVLPSALALASSFTLRKVRARLVDSTLLMLMCGSDQRDASKRADFDLHSDL